MDGVVFEGDGVEDLDDLGHVSGHAGFPAFLDGGGVVLGGSHEEVACGVPHLADKADAFLHHAADLDDIVTIGVDSVSLENGYEQVGHFFVAVHLHVFVVEPFGFFDVELGTALADMADVEELYQLVH